MKYFRLSIWCNVKRQFSKLVSAELLSNSFENGISTQTKLNADKCKNGVNESAEDGGERKIKKTQNNKYKLRNHCIRNEFKLYFFCFCSVFSLDLAMQKLTHVINREKERERRMKEKKNRNVAFGSAEQFC